MSPSSSHSIAALGNPADVDFRANPYCPPLDLPVEEYSVAEVADGQLLNPWLSIWTRPRATMRQIVDTDATRYVLPLAVLSGVGQALSQSSQKSWGDGMHLEAILLTTIVLGALFSVPGLYLGGWLLRETGRMLGGVGSSRDVRAAIAWSSLPTVCGLVIWIVLVPQCGIELFRSDGLMSAVPPAVELQLVAACQASVVLAVWQFVMRLKCLAEVHRFSVVRAFGAYVLAGIVFCVLVFVCAFVVGAAVASAGGV